jgi:hypothetical protein
MQVGKEKKGKRKTNPVRFHQTWTNMQDWIPDWEGLTNSNPQNNFCENKKRSQCAMA